MNRAERRRLAKYGDVEGIRPTSTPNTGDMLVVVLKVMSISLHDEFGFGKIRCSRVIQKVLDMFDAVHTDHLSGADINYMFNEIKGLHIGLK